MKRKRTGPEPVLVVGSVAFDSVVTPSGSVSDAEDF